MSKLMRKLLVTQGLAGPNGNGVINVLDITVGAEHVSQLTLRGGTGNPHKPALGPREDTPLLTEPGATVSPVAHFA